MSYYAIVDEFGIIRKVTNSRPRMLPPNATPIPIESMGSVDPKQQKWDFTLQQWVAYTPPAPGFGDTNTEADAMIENRRNQLATMTVADISDFVNDATTAQLKTAIKFLLVEVKRLSSL